MAKQGRRLAVQKTYKLFIGGNWTDKFAAVAGSVNPVASSHFNFTVPEPTISHLKKIGEDVKKDEPLIRVHARTEKSLARILPLLRQVAAIE
jgi:thymidine phosphorylase